NIWMGLQILVWQMRHYQLQTFDPISYLNTQAIDY
ncbi:MAG: hypothetical protein ACI94Z_002596, partial [Yoonia sp.]